MDSCHEFRFFTCKVSCLVVFWECYDHINCFTSRVSNQLVFETWDELTWTKSKWEVITFTTVKFNTVDRTYEVDHNCVTFCCSTFFNNQFSQVVAFTFDTSIHISVCYFFRNFYWYFKVFVSTQFYFRFCDNSCCQCPVLTFFHRYNIESWLCYNFNASFFNSCFVCCWKKIVQSILVKCFFTKTLVEDWTWNMTFTESRYVQGFLNRLKHTVQSRFDLLLADGESQYTVVSFFVFKWYRHSVSP